MDRIARGRGEVSSRVISLLEGGYDTSTTQGLAKSVNSHVKALRTKS
jgi:hypothetical protein